jgi:hypothetical protein
VFLCIIRLLPASVPQPGAPSAPSGVDRVIALDPTAVGDATRPGSGEMATGDPGTSAAPITGERPKQDGLLARSDGGLLGGPSDSQETLLGEGPSCRNGAQTSWDVS